MKSIFTTLLIVLSVNAAKAAVQEPEFCKLTTPYGDGESPFFKTKTVDVRKARELSAFQLGLVNDYLVNYGYLKQSSSLKEIQAFFKSEEQFNDLYLKIRTSKASGEVHVEVVSYPGDNPVGTVYNAATGEILGHNNDDSYSYSNGSEEAYCSDEQN